MTTISDPIEERRGRKRMGEIEWSFHWPGLVSWYYFYLEHFELELWSAQRRWQEGPNSLDTCWITISINWSNWLINYNFKESVFPKSYQYKRWSDTDGDDVVDMIEWLQESRMNELSKRIQISEIYFEWVIFQFELNWNPSSFDDFLLYPILDDGNGEKSMTLIQKYVALINCIVWMNSYSNHEWMMNGNSSQLVECKCCKNIINCSLLPAIRVYFEIAMS